MTSGPALQCVPSHPLMDWSTFECYLSRSRKVAYIKQPKAASEAITGMMRRMFADLERVPFCWDIQGFYVFTSQRNPLSRIRSAYTEVDVRALIYGPPSLRTRFSMMEHKNEPARFLTFLEDVFSQNFEAADYMRLSMPQHAHPHPLLLRPEILSSGLSRVLHTERMDSDWKALLDDLGLPFQQLPVYHSRSKGRYLSMDLVNESVKLQIASIVQRDMTFPWTPLAIQHVCQRYRSEFVCFGCALHCIYIITSRHACRLATPMHLYHARYTPEVCNVSAEDSRGLLATPVWPPGYAVELFTESQVNPGHYVKE